MEQKFKSLSIFDFQQKFPDDDACYQYLAQLKWPNGFSCPKCGHKHYCQGRTKHHRECTRCKHQASPKSQTLFHHVKFPLLKAFYIVYYMSTSKKGINSTELSRKLALRQKTCWGFQQKVRKAMESSQAYPMKGDEVEVDEMVVGGEEENVRGRQNEKKKLVVVGIEKQGKGISRMYGQKISKSSGDELSNFFDNHIDKSAKIRTDRWSGYKPLEKEYPHLSREYSGKKGGNFQEMHRAIMQFKGWLRGLHHHVEHLQAYINEYVYRFNRSFMKENIFDNLVERMVKTGPHRYQQLGIT
jgi:hypothetical protein